MDNRKIDHYIIQFELDEDIAEKFDECCREDGITAEDFLVKRLTDALDRLDEASLRKYADDERPILHNFIEVPVHEGESDDEALEVFLREHAFPSDPGCSSE